MQSSRVVRIVCKVVPNSRKEVVQVLNLENIPQEFLKWRACLYLKVNIKQKPQDGLANKRLILLLQKYIRKNYKILSVCMSSPQELGLIESGSFSISLVFGKTSRWKVVEIGL